MIRHLIEIKPGSLFLVTDYKIPDKVYSLTTRKRHFSKPRGTDLTDHYPEYSDQHHIGHTQEFFYYNYLTELFTCRTVGSSLYSLLQKQGVRNKSKLYWYLL